MKQLKFIGIIPARYASTRFPGKPLADLCGKPVIKHVYERASEILDNVAVATDDDRIFDAVKAFGGNAVMTRNDHPSGTDRIDEAFSLLNSDADVVINIQGDEPFIKPEQIRLLMDAFGDDATDIATLACPFNKESGFETLADPNLVKVTFADNGKALYFSRSVIPYVRGVKTDKWLETTDFFTHIGVYAYRASVLKAITKLKQSSLEKAESLEQLRWLQNGLNIKVCVTDSKSVGIDTPDDLENARNILKMNSK